MPLPLSPTTAEQQTLDEIRDWHDSLVEALLDRRAAVQHAILTGATVAPRFVGMTEADVESHYDADREELDRLTILNLVASAEASIMDDYIRRIRGRLKDPLARAYQVSHKGLSSRDQLRPPFDGRPRSVLWTLDETKLVNNHVIREYRECRPARHWFGHGRNWDKPTAVDRFDPEDVFVRAIALLTAMPA